MKQLFYFILCCNTCLTWLASAQCPSNLVTNGSFTSQTGNSVTAPGWIGTQSPDVNDASGILNTTGCYFWTGTPVSSADSGTWQNLFGVETVSQNLNLVAGQTYLLCFEYAAQGIECPPQFLFNQPVGIDVYIDNAVIMTTPDDTSQYSWEATCITFVAPGSQVNLKFGASQTQYVALDGVCLVPFTSAGDDLNSAAIKIYPNPFSHELHVMNAGNDYSEIQLYDLASKLLYSGSFRSTVTINTELFAPGIYFFIIKNNVGLFKSGKIIKE